MRLPPLVKLTPVFVLALVFAAQTLSVAAEDLPQCWRDCVRSNGLSCKDTDLNCWSLLWVLVLRHTFNTDRFYRYMLLGVLSPLTPPHLRCLQLPRRLGLHYHPASILRAVLLTDPLLLTQQSRIGSDRCGPPNASSRVPDLAQCHPYYHNGGQCGVGNGHGEERRWRIAGGRGWHGAQSGRQRGKKGRRMLTGLNRGHLGGHCMVLDGWRHDA